MGLTNKKNLFRLLTTVAIILGWIIFVAVFFAFEQWLWRPPVSRGDFNSIERFLSDNLENAAREERLGSAALVLVQRGKVATIRSFGIGDDQTLAPPKNDKTLFLLCSVSKAVSAWGILRLVEEGKIQLDDPILPYLVRWRFPGSNEYGSKVTIRHLLSHTSGLVDGFGFSGFPLDEPRQTPEQSLTYPADANMGQPHPAVIVNKPGTVMSYSSAGYTILQLLIEEISRKPFNDYMREAVFQPLGMVSSNYDTEEIFKNGQLANLAPNYDLNLNIHPHRKHSMMAGGSLRVTPDDLARFISAYYKNDILQPETIRSMFQPQPGTNGSWGLGHELYSKTATAEYIAGHGGGAFPRTGASFRVNPDTWNGIGIVMTGGKEMINGYIDAWNYWETGESNFDIRNVFHKRLAHIIIMSAIGALVLLVWELNRSKRKPQKVSNHV